MATQKLEDVISFIETQLNTLTKLDVVVYKGKDDQNPTIKDFGSTIYVDEEDFFEHEHKHIGPLLTESWHINVDVIIQRKSSTARKSVSDAFGISYWMSQLTALFLNKTNGGAFVRTEYNRLEVEELNTSIILKGKVTCEILNKYT